LAALLAVAVAPSLAVADAGSRSGVRVFEDEPPSVDQLRGIFAPESQSRGLSRKIEIPRRDSLGVPSPPQPATATVGGGDARPSANGDAESAPGAAAPVSGEAADGAGSSVAFRINFDRNSAVVPPAYFPFVDRIGEFLRQEPRVKLLIEGHTDATGSDGYNLRLSRLRAMAVADYLVKRQDVDPERLRVAGKGMREPLMDDPYDARNRRVQFVRIE
jgi:outer membrane protein OmpA-like peptidoglycan-associated protein